MRKQFRVTEAMRSRDRRTAATESEGTFPRRLYLSPARVAWVASEIEEYLARCIAARGQ